MSFKDETQLLTDLYGGAASRNAETFQGRIDRLKIVFDEAKEFMRLNGAKKAQCWARGSLVEMYKKMGMENTHQVMRVDL
jgi:hypothetical protein